jgi:hypothetical protein
MTNFQLFVITFFGAVFADLLAIAGAMKSGRLSPKRWTRPITYMGMALQGVIAGVLREFVLRQFADPLSAFSIGVNLPLILEKVATMTPNLAQPAVPRETGFGDSEGTTTGRSLENVRKYLAKEQ